MTANRYSEMLKNCRGAIHRALRVLCSNVKGAINGAPTASSLTMCRRAAGGTKLLIILPMPVAEFKYQDPFPITRDDTQYRLLTKDHISVATFDGQEILKIEPDALVAVASEAFRDVSFLLRT